MPGPLPKRAIERRRRNVTSDVDRILVTGPVRRPPVPGDWDPLAKRLFRSLAESGHSVLMEPTDWAYALLAGAATTALLTCPGSSTTARGQREHYVCAICKHVVPVAAGSSPRQLERHRRAELRAGLLHEVSQMWKDLLFTEGERRHWRVEIEREFGAAEPETKISAMERYRDRIARPVEELDDDEEPDGDA